LNQPFFSMIFLGIMLIAVSVIWIHIDRKRFESYEKRMDRKKDELMAIISDADEMVDELNRFSNYIVTQLDIKNEEVLNNIKKYDQKLSSINEKVNKSGLVKESEVKWVVNGNRSDMIIESIEAKSLEKPSVQKQYPQGKKYEKVIPINNSKHRKVLELASQGLNEIEIARNLKMGKGEIQLILEINR
jgi:hypothetical protein